MYQWYLTTAATRLSPDGAIVIVATRWHPQDLIGCLLKDAETSGEKWRIITFKAIDDNGAALWPERWPIEKLERIRASYNASGYPWQWEALYQQEPPDILDSEWPAEYFGDDIWFDEWPHKNDCILRVVALDPSLGKTDKADYSAFVYLAKGKDRNYYIDADIARRPSSEIVKAGMQLFDYWKPDAFGCESNQFQELLRAEFEEGLKRASSPVKVFGIHNSMNKIIRIRLLTSLLAAGRLKFKRGSPGVNLLLEQMKGFPAHKHDDGPDALEMGVRLCDELITGVPQAIEERMGANMRAVL